MKISRRAFLAGSAAAGALTVLPRTEAGAAPGADSFATIIDLHRCDGCPDLELPACVAACREHRGADFPEPAPDQLRDYWPQKKHEDMSGKRHLADRFTPYNWLFVQKVEVEGRTVCIPRRCMHCDNPPCAKLCPFGVKHKTPEGPVYIDHALCFGGAKCRDVCPWKVPQRQAGVGIYTLWQHWLPVGGGVMYKCDLCRERLADGGTPHCMAGCPQKAMRIGKRDEIFAEVEAMKKEGAHVYGLTENGGTSTLYVSPVAFDKLDQAIVAQGKAKQMKRIARLHPAPSLLQKQSGWAWLNLAAPVAGVLGALGLASRKDGPRPDAEEDAS